MQEIEVRVRRRAGGAGTKIRVRQVGQKVQGLDAQNDKEGRGCRRQKLRVKRRAEGAGAKI
jgi:hypothetical protein